MTEKPLTPPKRTQIQVELPANLSALYVNFAMITQTLSEIILDFAQVLPNTPKARVQSRLILTPTNAKLLYKALGESLERYESTHGEIKVPPTLADQLFQAVRTDLPPGETSPDKEAPTGQGDKGGDHE